tara:strand:- start:194 stop:403 length:210 start_codon:yes stop_codon:yes gene_type:complete
LRLLAKRYRRQNLPPIDALTEAANKQSHNGLVKDYVVERDERLIDQHLVCAAVVVFGCCGIALRITLRT